MICSQCKKDRGIHCRGMCNACYTKWRRSGKPALSFDYKSPSDKFEADCRNGVVSGMIVQKMTHLDIARRYGIAESTARKYMEKHGVIVIKAKKTKKKDRSHNIFYDESRMLALASPWVKNETPRYYLPV
jgi:hypothetical protein